MKYKLKDFGAYKLHLIKTKKFKTITFRVSFRRPIKKNEITMRNILCDLFLQSTSNYKDKRSLTIKAQDLYAADIQASNSRLGNYITTDFYLSVLNDKYTEEGNLSKSIDFLEEIIFKPDVKDNRFNKEKLEIVKASCKDSLSSIKEDSSYYSLIRMFEELDIKSPYSYRMSGYKSDLNLINEENIYTYYLDMIKNDLLDIFIIGDIDFKQIEEIISKKFNFNIFKKIKTDYFIPMKKARRSKIVKEKSSNSQSKISIGCRLYDLSEYERNYPLTLFSIIFGGGVDSKLFKEVREKNSLCYSINCVPNKLDNILIIRAGIDKKNFDKTIRSIKKCLKDMKNGLFDENDIMVAKEYFNTALDELEESQYRIIDNYFLSDLIGTDDISTKRKMMNKVTKKEIVEVSKKVKIDTIFLLEGDNDEKK